MVPTSKLVPRELEDALVYLPRKGVVEYRRGQVIYDDQQAPAGLYLVVQGRVKVSITMEDGSQTVTGVFCSDDFSCSARSPGVLGELTFTIKKSTWGCKALKQIS